MKFQSLKVSKLQSAGFTMIELLVGMSLFGILSGIVGGSFISILRSQKTVLALIYANDNANLVLEQMAREFRTGLDFETFPGDAGICFRNARGELVVYKFDSNEFNIKRGVVVDCGDSSDIEPVTSPDIKVRNLRFRLTGRESGDRKPTLITVSMELTGGRGSIENIKINIQTSISSRILD